MCRRTMTEHTPTADDIEEGDTITWEEEWAGIKTFVARVTNVREVEISEPFMDDKTVRKFELEMVEGDAEKADPSLDYPNSDDATPEISDERFDDGELVKVEK